jgi:hypothetical protein
MAAPGVAVIRGPVLLPWGRVVVGQTLLLGRAADGNRIVHNIVVMKVSCN